MISERNIAEKFSVVWKQHFPLLTPNFMRVFNESHIEMINKTDVPIIEDIRYDIVSELAFNISEILFKENKSFDAYIENKERFNKLAEHTAKSIWKSGNYKKSDLILSNFEIGEAKKICNNIIEFIESIKNGEIEFKPKLKGYSFIPDLVADISIGNTLFEIKTVNRNFKSSDLKQLFLYLALRQVTGGNNWKYAGLYNPRKGTYCMFNVKSLIFNLSGGNSPNETFENLLNCLVRDIEIDSKF
jgi:hypothetical protein